MEKTAYVRKYYPLRHFVSFVAICVLTGCIPAIQVIVEARLIDEAILGVVQNALPEFTKYLGIYTFLFLCSSILQSFLQKNTEQHMLVVGKRFDSERLEKADRVPFQMTETQAFHELFEKAGKAADLDNAFYNALGQEILGFVKVITTFTVLFTVDAWVSIILIALLLLGAAINRKAAQNVEGFWEEYIQNMRRANYLSTLLLHREYAAERKIFGYGQEIETRYGKDFSAAVDKNSKLGKRRFHAECAATFFTIAYNIAVVLALIWPLSKGKISIGTFIAAFSAANRLRDISSQIYDAIFTGASSFAQLSGFFSFLELDEERKRPSNQGIDRKAGIEFRHVSFSYPGSNVPVLDDVNFKIQNGSHYALVGENGCGKTTLVKLLLGLYQPTGGSILAGGKDITDMSREERRGLFSVMFQDFYHYPISIRENVSLGSGEALDQEEIRSILSLLGVNAPILSERDGLDRDLMLLKDGGVDISGGEWQKIAAARCILSPAPIAVLDEPNAALDPVSEAAFYQAYKEMLAEKTTIFISHRLGAVKSADKILVLRNSHLIAMDTHEELMQTCEYYRGLYETQRGLYYGL